MKIQIVSNKKIYSIDNGFITSKGFSFSKNQGSLYENIVAIVLREQELLGRIRLYYWKNAEQEEVDFVIQKNRQVILLIQVCTSIFDEKTKSREVRALLKASRELQCANLLVLTLQEDRESKEEWFGIQGVVRYMPLWKWLLQEPDLLE